MGKDFFYQYINNIKKFFTRSKLITWGVGFTLYENKKTLLDPDKIQHKNIHENIFEGFDLIGCRDFGLNFKNYTWLPCASCMHNDFEKFYSKISVPLPFQISCSVCVRFPVGIIYLLLAVFQAKGTGT